MVCLDEWERQTQPQDPNDASVVSPHSYFTNLVYINGSAPAAENEMAYLHSTFVFRVDDLFAQSCPPDLLAYPTPVQYPAASYRNSKKSNSKRRMLKNIIRLPSGKKGIVYCSVGERKYCWMHLSQRKEQMQNGSPSSSFTVWVAVGRPSQHHPLAQQLANRAYAFVCNFRQYRLSTEAFIPGSCNIDIKTSIRW